MARPLRVEYPGAHYHVMARGNERKKIFLSVKDHELFLKTLRQMTKFHHVLIQAYCLMPNHFHLAITTPDANLSKAIGWMQTTFTIRYNKKYHRVGHLFQGRFKAHLVGSEDYGKELVRYIHLNPVRPQDKKKKIPLSAKQRLMNYRWSSHQEYLGKRKPSDWLSMEWLNLWNKNRKKAHREYQKEINSYFDKPIEPLWDKLRGGLVLGSESLLEKAKELIGKKEYGPEQEWVKGQEYETRQTKLREKLDQEADEDLKIWLRVHVGGERKVAVARDYGYSNGSGLLYVLRKVEEHALTDSKIKERLKHYKNFFKV